MPQNKGDYRRGRKKRLHLSAKRKKRKCRKGEANALNIWRKKKKTERHDNNLNTSVDTSSGLFEVEDIQTREDGSEIREGGEVTDEEEGIKSFGDVTPTVHSTPISGRIPPNVCYNMSPISTKNPNLDSTSANRSVDNHELITTFTQEEQPKTCLDDMTGRCYADMGHIFRSIFADSSHEGGFGCSFLDTVLVSERFYGLRCNWVFKCRVCKKETRLSSEDHAKIGYMSVNNAAVHGIVAIGAGYTQLVTYNSAMDMHCMDNKTYAECFKNVADAIHDAAWLAMEEAGKIEVEIAIREGNLDKDGVPLCIVVADGQWCKRSYKTKYDSLSGVISYCELVDNKLLLKLSANYYYQIQGQLHITKRKMCYFVQYTKHWLTYEVIEKDDEFWKKNMFPQLERFYMNCLLPELVEPQYSKRLVIADIKDPPYILEAQAAAAKAKTVVKQKLPARATKKPKKIAKKKTRKSTVK